MLPESIYHADECETFGAAVLPSIIQGRGDEQAQYRKQVEEGIPLGKGYYLRCFPVWFSFRGNFNVQLSTALSVAAGASLRSNQAPVSYTHLSEEFLSLSALPANEQMAVRGMNLALTSIEGFKQVNITVEGEAYEPVAATLGTGSGSEYLNTMP